MERTEPTFSLPVPEGWLIKESVTLVEPDGRANVIASSEPIGPDWDTDRYQALQGDLFADEDQYPGFKQFTLESLSLDGGREAMLRRFRWTPPDVGEVTQFQLYFVEDGRAYTVTATASSQEFPKYERLMIETIRGLLMNRSEVVA